MNELYEMSAVELADAYRRKKTDPVEVMRTLLDRITSFNETVGAFVAVTRRRAEAEAIAARELIESGDDRILLGITCPIKDLTRVAGEHYSAGSTVFKGQRTNLTDGVAQRLADAGTVLLGKTTTPEFGMTAYTEPAGQHPARTPWDITRTAGGSSGGAAAALAAGLTPLAHGNDGGGSIRIPAACCGVVGLKPSRGRVSPGPHKVPGPGLAAEGVLTRTVVDAAVTLDAIAGSMPGDVFSLPAGSRGGTGFAVDLAAAEATGTLSCSPDGAPIRVGILLEPLNVAELEFHLEALVAVRRAANLLVAAGCLVSDTTRAISAEQWDSFLPVWAVAAATIPVPSQAEGQLMPITRWLRERGRATSAVQYADAVTALQRLSRQISKHWMDYDVILSPTLSGPPPVPAELQKADPAADFVAQKCFTPIASGWNITGAPGISVPIHRAEIGGVELPFAVHLGATTIGAEMQLLRLARLLEQVDPWPILAPAYR